MTPWIGWETPSQVLSRQVHSRCHRCHKDTAQGIHCLSLSLYLWHHLRPGIYRLKTDGHFSIGNLLIKICKIERKRLSYRDLRRAWDWGGQRGPLGFRVVSSHSAWMSSTCQRTSKLWVRSPSRPQPGMRGLSPWLALLRTNIWQIISQLEGRAVHW